MKQFILIVSLTFSLVTFITSCDNTKRKDDANLPNGWYHIKNGTQDSIVPKPFVTVKDFKELRLDSTTPNENGDTYYVIIGRIKDEKLKNGEMQPKWQLKTNNR